MLLARYCLKGSLLATAVFANAHCAFAESNCQALPIEIPDAPAIRLNHVGFEADAAKTAILRTDAKAAQPWMLRDQYGNIAAQGQTRVFGTSPAAGEPVHRIELPKDLAIGQGYTLSACNVRSRPFAVQAAPYETLSVDSLSYFYQNRAAIPIEARYVRDPKWARPAGHVTEVATCFAGEDKVGLQWPGCAHSLDVSGGWYDAGDFGKYAVNGGFSVWLLLNSYERLQNGNSAAASGWGDGRVPIPERENGVSDILDEARWQIEFLLSLQIPQGAKMAVAKGIQEAPETQPMALTTLDVSGLVHHKVHAAKWPALPLKPSEETAERFLYPPSTSATLNMAAVAAQCARLWRSIDDAFADRCLAAAVRGYDAARRHPDLYAYNNFDGGGPYDDTDVSDEFGWAATELYTTTGDARYLQGLVKTPGRTWLARNRDGALGDLGWRNVDLLPAATILAAKDRFSDGDRNRAAGLLKQAADLYVADARTDAYGVPYPANEYGWGSNGALAARSVALGYTYDVTGDATYRKALVDSLDYLLGRNPLDQSYIAGYGERAVENVHHRFWAQGADPNYPPAAPGALSGGPNAGYPASDYEKAELGPCAPMRCWVDDHSAFSLNEVAINWNAALFWLTSYLDTTPPAAITTITE